jgi:hypothetical protein
MGPANKECFMQDSTTKTMTIDTIDRQRQYVEIQKAKGNGLGVVFADAFLRGMRDLGYKNPAWALAEQLDNAFQAGADTVAIRFGFQPANKSQAKPDQIAICDNGNGMIADMISYAVRWGGTDREGDRNGFGRYGYGLPSSAVSLAKRYTVYSRATGGEWYAVTVDIDELAEAAGDIKKTEALLSAKRAALPTWVAKAAKDDDRLDVGALTSGTVVVLEDLDRLRNLTGWIKADSLRTKLLQHFGVIYRHWIPERQIHVNGGAVQVVDPLFLMEHGRFYDETPVRAERIETRTFQVESSRGTTGTVTIRASVLPPHFQLADPAQYGLKAKLNKRHDVMKDYNGLLICRERRQIDTISPRWTRFQVYDYNIKIEIDFDPELDEYFGITTAKQQIVIDDEMWEKLQHSGKNGGALTDLVKDLRARFEELQKKLNAKYRNRAGKDTPRASVVAMEESAKFKGSAPAPTPAQREEAEKNLEQLASTRAELTGEPKEKVLEELALETSRRRWEVEFTAITEGPFYRPTRLGEQKRLVINTDHPFYTKIYDAAPEVRAALEVLLFVIAERELEVKNDAETFYKAERQRWSERLRHALDTLVSEESLVDKAAAVAERMHIAMAEEALAG